MVHALEDEIDWSDGPLGPPSPEFLDPAADFSSVYPEPYLSQEFADLEAPYYHQHPVGSPVPSST